MKILVLGGSPKGNVSVTMQYVRYLSERYKSHNFDIEQPSFYIRKLENDALYFNSLMEKVKGADVVLWAFPIYYCLVHSGYKRFIELIFEKGASSFFNDKYTASLSTSIHFFDNTAHNYIEEICSDLKMKYICRHSPNMDDLTKKEGQKELENFFETILYTVDNNLYCNDVNSFNKTTIKEYEPIIDLNRQIETNKKVVVLTDSLESNIGKMVNDFKSLYINEVDVYDISAIKTGRCLGCLKCGEKNICAYNDKDEYISFYNNRVKTADIIIFAGEIKDRYLSSVWQRFFERSFFNTHTPSLSNKQFGFIISGPISQRSNMKEILKAYTEWQSSNFNGFASDSEGIQTLAKRVVHSSTNNLSLSKSFMGVGGMMIFRDDIFDHLKIIFRADHKFYKKHGLYNFPHSKILKRIFINLIYLITSLPFIRKKMSKNMKEFMLMPYQKAIKTARTKS